MAYIETRFYNNGAAEAKFHNKFEYPQIETSDKFDTYVESIGDSKVQVDFNNSSDFKTLEEWVGYLEIESKDITTMISNLKKGEWVNISGYC